MNNNAKKKSVLEYVVKNLTLQEVLKMIREISWDMVYYNDKNEMLKIYQQEAFENLANRYIETANKNGGKDNITVVIMKG